MKAITETWKTLTDTFTVVGRYRSYSLFPLLAYVGILFLTFTAVAPLLAAVLGSNLGAGLRWTLFALVVYLAYGVLYFVIAFFNVALVTGISARLDGDDPARRGELLARGVQRSGLIGAYSGVAATLGLVSILARVLINPLFGGLVAPRIGNRLWTRWHQLSYNIPLQLAVPVIALDQPAPENLFVRGEQLVKATWGERVKPAHSISLVALVALIIVMGYATPTLQQGLDESNAGQTWQGLSVMLITISTYAQLSALVNAIFALAAYRYATAAEPDLFPGDASYAESAFVQSKKATNNDEVLTTSLADAPPVIADKSSS